MKIAVVGGGITGLTAAYLLSKKGEEVTVFEKEKKPGGLTSSFKDKEWTWSLERFYHHFFSSDKAIADLLKEIGLQNKIIFKKPQTSVFIDNKTYRFDSAKSIILFPKLSPKDKLLLVSTTIFMKINPFWQPLEKLTAYSFIKKTMGAKNFELIWKPLMESKFGTLAPQIPASWFWTRIQKRSFKLGYLDGGTETLIDSLVQRIRKNGGEILLGQKVNKINKSNDKFEIFAGQKKFTEMFDKVITCVSPQTLASVFPQLDPKKKESLEKLKSLGAICLVIELKESFLTDGTYWLNINDSSYPFVAVVEHTNFIDKKNYNGSVILYVGGYYALDNPLFSDPEQEILDKFIPYLEKIHPNFNFEKNLKNFWVFKEEYTQPVPFLSYSLSLPSIKTGIKGLYWGSLHHVYPQDRGINYAIILGEKIANEIIAQKD